MTSRQSQGRRAVCQVGRGCVVHAGVGHDSSCGNEVSALRRDEVREGNGHLRRVAGVGRELSGADRDDETGLSLAFRSVSRRRRSVPRMVPVFPALRHGHACHVRRTKAWSRRDGRSTKKARPCRSRAATTWTRWISPAVWAEKSCGCGSRRSISAKTWSARKR